MFFTSSLGDREMTTIETPSSPLKILKSGHEKLELITEKIQELFPNGCKKILFVHPMTVSEQDFDLEAAKNCSYSAAIPYGIALLSRHVRCNGYISLILDLNYEMLLQAHENPNFKYSDWKTKLENCIHEFKPDIVGISVMFSTTHQSMVEIIEQSKLINPAIPVVVGGNYASQYPKAHLENLPLLDFVMTNEADRSFITFLDFINKKRDAMELSQIATLSKGTYASLEKVDQPNPEVFDVIPDYQNLPIGNYTNVGMIGAYRWLVPPPKRAGLIHSNRGCRAHCTFCTVEFFNGAGVRSRDPENVADEIQWMKEYYGIEQFLWLDDDLFHRNAVALFNAIARRNLHITWEASNGVIASATTDEIMHAAAESGCIGLHFGIESGNEEILRAVKKPSGVKHFHRVGELVKKYPQIYTRGMLMLGFRDIGGSGKNETIGQIWDTINLGLKIQLDWYPIQIVQFLGNTQMTKEMIKRGSINEQSIVDATFFVGAFGDLLKRQKKERQHAKQFHADLLDRPKEYEPTDEEVRDLWVPIDYKLNYEPILAQTDPFKLGMKRLMMQDICKRKSSRNPIPTMFLGIIEQKLGMLEEAKNHFAYAEKYLSESEFWNIRCHALGIDKLLKQRIAMC